MAQGRYDFGKQALLPDRKGAELQTRSLRISPLIPVQRCQASQRLNRLRMIFSQVLLKNLASTLIVSFGLLMLALLLPQPC